MRLGIIQSAPLPLPSFLFLVFLFFLWFYQLLMWHLAPLLSAHGFNIKIFLFQIVNLKPDKWSGLNPCISDQLSADRVQVLCQNLFK